MFSLQQLCAAAYISPSSNAALISNTRMSSASACFATMRLANKVITDDDEEISDLATGIRWVGIQGIVDLSVLAIFASINHYSLSDILTGPPELKYIVFMPAFCTFSQIYRRFAPEDYEVKDFETDPIVQYREQQIIGWNSHVKSVAQRSLRHLVATRSSQVSPGFAHTRLPPSLLRSRWAQEGAPDA